MAPRRKPLPPHEGVNEALAVVLLELRTRHGLSQEQLGHEIGSGRTYISELERERKHRR